MVLTAGAGYAAGAVDLTAIDWTAVAALSVGTSLAAGSANTFNQIIEGQRDRRMKRTALRPLPSNRISYAHATAFGVGSGVTSFAILAAGTNPVTAGLGLANIGLYAGPYTLSKPRSELNTWVGAVVGAIPPVMGWCAAGGSPFDLEAGILASTLFLWQFPHFFALAWIHKKDYARGGHQMVPVNDPSGERTARLILQYSLLMFPVPILAAMSDSTSYMFALEGTAATAYLTYLGADFYRERSQENARRIFKCSLWYLPLLLAFFVFHRKKKEERQARSSEASADGEEDAGALWPIERVKSALRAVCLHEAIFTPSPQATTSSSSGSPQDNAGFSDAGFADKPAPKALVDASPLCPATSAVNNSGANLPIDASTPH